MRATETCSTEDTLCASSFPACTNLTLHLSFRNCSLHSQLLITTLALSTCPLTAPIFQSSSGQDKKKKDLKSDATSSKAPKKGKKTSKATPKKKEETKTAKKKVDKGKAKC
jgi:hypothetical protein